MNMQIERRALYNLMRMNWLLDATLPAEPWQVADYRSLPTETLFERLKAHHLNLDKNSFLAYTEEVDAPEELVDLLLGDLELDAISQDQIYLLLFELWRRFVTDRPCLSIFCDELDHQIYQYDNGNGNIETLQDCVANLQTILDENADRGVDGPEVFASICNSCANDIESFLYDFVSDQLDANNTTYASDLIDGFTNYIIEIKWFDFLRTRLGAAQGHEDAKQFITQLIDIFADDGDLEFNMELLAFSVPYIPKESFVKLLKKTIPQLFLEEDFQDLIKICIDFYHYLDQEATEKELEKVLEQRALLSLENPLSHKDPQIAKVLSIVK